MMDTAVRPQTSAFQQWWVLTVRMITPTLRNGEVVTLIAAAIMFSIGFYLPLKGLMGGFPAGMSSYAQYLMPLIALNGIAFAAISAAFRSATDSVQGINRRFKTMPIAALTPLAARMSASVYRCVVALCAALVCGHIIGFRFYGGVGHAVGFCLLALLIGAVTSLLGDLIGAANSNPEATVPLMLVPQMILGLLSVGLQPIERFPAWIQPIVRNQEVSQFVYALRPLGGDSTPAAGEVTWSVMGPTFAWLAGWILMLIPLHVYIATRRR
ncbi:antibiotic transporter [Mycolicibacterium agri]|uniref:Antibiotic transporter n=1 Tax=Mycolicibacterium agri TaxID=36811 RepID=A0A2A7MSN0_MYCAG|nr:ABC transporter permease [Mycolicibacterium agri]PEG34517.1 antibiotic transporter [Mycolicibacterium agri]GFG54679.1 doxorubicin resistance ABC transporter permease protein DrrB [Mycolicibacterium agri]